MKKITFCIVLLIGAVAFAAESDDECTLDKPGMNILAVISSQEAKKQANLKDRVLGVQWQTALKARDLEIGGATPRIVIGEKKSPKTKRFNKKQIDAFKVEVKK